MPSKLGAASLSTRRFSRCRNMAFCGLAAAGLISLPFSLPGARAETRPEAAVLLDRLCTERLRPNEEDRVYGLISLTVRATIKYHDGIFSPDLIDDAVQDALGAIVEACPRIAATDDAQRLGQAIELIRDGTLKRMQDPKAGYSDKQTEKATAADLSQELSAQEIDAWLEALPARQRAIALFLYASDVTNDDIAEAVGLAPAELGAAFRAVKADLLKFFRQEWEAAPPPPAPASPAVEFREAGQALAPLLAPPVAPPAILSQAAPSPPAPPPITARVTGISTDLYSGWSLLATVTGLASDRGLEIAAPILLEPDKPGRRRMVAVALDEISDPQDKTRRFLIKAFAIDADLEGAGLQDGFHLGAAALDNAAARQTLGTSALAAIEVARCLWHDFGTAGDPGLCR